MALHKETLVFPHSDILWNVEVANFMPNKNSLEAVKKGRSQVK